MDNTAALTQSGQRDYLFDNLKALLIFLVLFGHAMELYTKWSKTPFILDTVYFVIYTFHMPFFVFVSGYFSKNVEKCRKAAFSTFLIPYLLFNTVFYYYINYVLHEKVASNFLFTPVYAYWYLLSMFIWRITVKDVANIRLIMPISIVIGLGAGLFTEFGTFMSLSRTFVFLPFFIFGYKFNDNTVKTIRKVPWYIGLLGVGATVFATLWVYKYTAFPWYLIYNSGSYTSVGLKAYDGLLFRGIMYLIAFSFIIFFIIAMPRAKSFVSDIGRNTLPIYIFHPFLIYLWPLINPFAKNMYMNVAMLAVVSLVLTYILSRPFFIKLYDDIVKGLQHLIFKADQTI